MSIQQAPRGLSNPQESGEDNASPIVVVRLRGGLGNQMFQYSVGRCISLKQNRELFLDDSPLHLDIAGTTKRQYALQVFDLNVKLLKDWQPQISARSPVEAYLLERNPGFFQEVLEPNPFQSVCLQGFWQNENYFLDIQDVIRDDFKLKPGARESSPYHAQIADAASPVCVHVRRKDYLTGEGSHLGFVGIDYYHRAAETILRQVNNPHFFVFSDDAQWCEENLRFDGACSIVRHDASVADSTAIHFALMTMCRHFIAANSSFSWWAAWLGADPNKVVIAPARWFRNDRPGSEKVVPASWSRC